MSVFWIVLTVTLLVIEVATVNLVTVWFAVGAIAAAVSTFLGASPLTSVVIFTVVSILSLLFTRPLVKKFLTVKKTPTNIDRVIGQEGVVIPSALPSETLRVRAMGLEWNAKSNDTTVTLAVGDCVKVESLDGLILTVSKIPSAAALEESTIIDIT